VPPRSQRTGTYQAALVHRGKYTLGPLFLTTRFPLSFVERSWEVRDTAELIVHPRLGRLTPQWHREETFADEMVQQARSRTGAYEDEFHRLREYRSGDNPRAIHWRTSARRNQLMVREYHQNRERDLAVLLDLWLPRHPTPQDRERLELAVSFAATICVEQFHNSRESQLFLGICGEKPLHWEGQAGPLSIQTLLDQLATAQGSPIPDPSTLTEKFLHTAAVNLQRIIVSSRPLKDGVLEGLETIQTAARQRGLPLRVISVASEDVGKFFERV
jgi:uncharacterized protein (DUF58 family)